MKAGVSVRRQLQRGFLRASLAAMAGWLLLGAGSLATMAQVLDAAAGPIRMGHVHLNVTSVEEHKRFWIDALGGASLKLGQREIAKFPRALILMTPQAPTGGTKGSSVNHIGFEVPNLRAAVDKLKAAGYRMVTREEVPAEWEVRDDLCLVPTVKRYIAFVMGPDNTKVELLENKDATVPVAFDHIHFFTPDLQKMHEWYVQTFGAKPVAPVASNARTATLPGVRLNVTEAAEAGTPTQGRAVDHIGFEIQNLQEFCRKLESQGYKLDQPYTRVEGANVAIAYMTDPWGTRIELTEGMDKL